MVYQFHRNDQNDGMILFFRRPNCEHMDQHVKLHGLDENAVYEIFYEDFGTTVKKTAEELMEEGITVRLLEKRTSLLITYKNMD